MAPNTKTVKEVSDILRPLPSTKGDLRYPVDEAAKQPDRVEPQSPQSGVKTKETETYSTKHPIYAKAKHNEEKVLHEPNNGWNTNAKRRTSSWRS